MKYLKTYENSTDILPNKSDKKYWVFYNYFNDDKGNRLKIKYILKFVNDEDMIIFNAILATDFIIRDKYYKIGEISDDVEFSPNGLNYHQDEGNLRLATPEEKQKYIFFQKTSKYNL